MPKADVVITNPTHFAVAIKYIEKMSAPYVVAKGADYMAQRIKQIAMDNKVHIWKTNPWHRPFSAPLTGAVPPELYKAVAEVLAFVYNLEGKPLQNK